MSARKFEEEEKLQLVHRLSETPETGEYSWTEKRTRSDFARLLAYLYASKHEPAVVFIVFNSNAAKNSFMNEYIAEALLEEGCIKMGRSSITAHTIHTLFLVRCKKVDLVVTDDVHISKLPNFHCPVVSSCLKTGIGK